MLPFKSWNVETRSIHESCNSGQINIFCKLIKKLDPKCCEFHLRFSIQYPSQVGEFQLQLTNIPTFKNCIFFKKCIFQKCFCRRCIFQELSQIEELPMSPLAADKSAHFPGRHPHLYHPPLPYSDPILPPWWGNKKKTIGNTEFNFQKSGSISL